MAKLSIYLPQIMPQLMPQLMPPGGERQTQKSINRVTYKSFVTLSRSGAMFGPKSPRKKKGFSTPPLPKNAHMQHMNFIIFSCLLCLLGSHVFNLSFLMF